LHLDEEQVHKTLYQMVKSHEIEAYTAYTQDSDNVCLSEIRYREINAKHKTVENRVIDFFESADDEIFYSSSEIAEAIKFSKQMIQKKVVDFVKDGVLEKHVDSYRNILYYKKGTYWENRYISMSPLSKRGWNIYLTTEDIEASPTDEDEFDLRYSELNWHIKKVEEYGLEKWCEIINKNNEQLYSRIIYIIKFIRRHNKNVENFITKSIQEIELKIPGFSKYKNFVS